jgi:hypothetical protein
MKKNLKAADEKKKKTDIKNKTLNTHTHTLKKKKKKFIIIVHYDQSTPMMEPEMQIQQQQFADRFQKPSFGGFSPQPQMTPPPQHFTPLPGSHMPNSSFMPQFQNATMMSPPSNVRNT